jgi:hypothetical protein
MPLPDGRWLAMSPEAFEAALTEGAKLSAVPAAAPPCNWPYLKAEAGYFLAARRSASDRDEVDMGKKRAGTPR